MTDLVFECETFCSEETEKIGESFAEKIKADPSLPFFIALYGDLGVGKTAFIRGFCKVFSTFSVHSPTYTIVNEYPSNIRKIYHFDMYRIKDEDDLYSIGYDDYIDGKGICLCEWSEKIEGSIPNPHFEIKIAKNIDKGEDYRTIKTFIVK